MRGVPTGAPSRLTFLTLAVAAVVMMWAEPARGQLANAPWPMYRHDARHTGRSPATGPSVPAVKWTYSIRAGDLSPSVIPYPVVAADGTIYVATGSCGCPADFVAVNPDGTPRWSNAFDVYSSPAIGHDGTLHKMGGGRFFAEDPTTGDRVWTFFHSNMFPGSSLSSSPAIGADGTIYVGTEIGLLALNANGTLKWLFGSESDGPVVSSPAVGADGTIYVGAGRFAPPGLVALNPDGTLRWTFPTGRLVRSSPAVGDDGTIYVGSQDHSLYAVNPDGTLKWSFTTGDRIDLASPAVGPDGTIFVASNDRYFYALNPDGTLKWALETGLGTPQRSSPVVAADGMIYDTIDGKLLAIAPDGAIQWTSDLFFTTPPDTSFDGVVSPLALGADGTLYAVFSDGKLYAIGQGNTPVGTEVAVDLGGGLAIPGAAAVTFAEVTAGGDTALTAGDTGPAPPAGFALGTPPTYYDITTTAAFAGPATVCINYTATTYQSESELRLFHLEDGAWVDRTVSRDTDSKVICASVESFSPFAILERTGTSLSALTPAKLWVGLANSDGVGLRLDLKVELFVNSTSTPPVATGTAGNLGSGSSGPGNALLNTVPLALTNGPAVLDPGNQLLLRVSVRRTCAGGGHASGIARLWYNGVAIDSGQRRDTASRFGAVVDGAGVTYYLRANSALARTPGSSRLFADTPVNSAIGCSSRPYTPFGTWSVMP